MNAYKTFENDKYKLEICIDESSESPRRWDNLAKMVCSHKRYNLGDKHDYKHDDYDGWDEMKKAIIKKEKAVVILPLYMYDHSGITISTSPFGCRWDSGQVGLIFVSRENAVKEFGKRITKEIKEKITDIINIEVKTYDQYVRGDIYGFNLKNKENGEEDSCWGFYGDNVFENGMSDHIEDEVMESLKEEISKEYKMPVEVAL